MEWLTQDFTQQDWYTLRLMLLSVGMLGAMACLFGLCMLAGRCLDSIAKASRKRSRRRAYRYLR